MHSRNINDGLTEATRPTHELAQAHRGVGHSCAIAATIPKRLFKRWTRRPGLAGSKVRKMRAQPVCKQRKRGRLIVAMRQLESPHWIAFAGWSSRNQNAGKSSQNLKFARSVVKVRPEWSAGGEARRECRDRWARALPGHCVPEAIPGRCRRRWPRRPRRSRF